MRGVGQRLVRFRRLQEQKTIDRIFNNSCEPEENLSRVRVLTAAIAYRLPHQPQKSLKFYQSLSKANEKNWKRLLILVFHFATTLIA